MEQNTTEIMLTLGLADRMAGTAYRTDPVLTELKRDYDKVPVLAAQYPGREALLAAKPDFVYSMRASAYAPDAGGVRGIWPSWESRPTCPPTTARIPS